MAKVEIRFDSERPYSAEVEIDGKVVSRAYNLHLHISPTEMDFVLQKYATDENGEIIMDKNGPKEETIHLKGPSPRVIRRVCSEIANDWRMKNAQDVTDTV